MSYYFFIGMANMLLFQCSITVSKQLWLKGGMGTYKYPKLQIQHVKLTEKIIKICTS